MNAADRLLQRLDQARVTGPDSWLARCPAHDDRSPSLSIKEVQDGTVLVKCFAGCETLNIVHAVGLEFADLFPPRQHRGEPVRDRKRDGQAMDALRALEHEARIVHCAAGWLANGNALSGDDLQRLRQAEHAIKSCLEVLR